MTFGEPNQMTEISVFQVTLANVDFVNIFLFQEFLHTSLKFSDNTGIPVWPMIKKAFEPITQFRIFFKVLLQR